MSFKTRWVIAFTLPLLSVPVSAAGSADKFLIVDCLLPGQVRRLGGQMAYLSARRPIRTSASDCEIRGGEYVSYDRADYRTALEVWLPRAKEGDPEAMANVGEVFEKGIGSNPDYAAAALWYRRAAEKGFSRAMLNLGFLYESGFGVERNLKEAMHWYRSATGTDAEIAIEPVTSALQKPPTDPAAKAESEALQRELAELRRQQEALNAELIRARRQLVNQKHMEEELEELRSERSQLQTEADRASDLQARFAEAQAATNRYKRDLDRLTEQLSQERSRIDDQTDQASELSGALMAAREDAETMREERDRLESELENARQSLAAGSTMGEQVEALEAQLQSASDQSAERDAELRRLEQSSAQHLAEHTRQKAYVRELETELARAREEVEHGRQQQQRLMSALENAEDTLATSSAEAQLMQQQAARADQLDALLNATREELESVRAQLQFAAESSESMESTLNQQQSELATTTSALQRREVELAALEQNLAEQRSVVAARDRRVAELEHKLAEMEQAARDREQQLVAEAAAEAILAPPEITLIDPVISATRSAAQLPVIPSSSEKRQVVGRVDVPAGLLALSLNDAPVTLSTRGMFNHTLELSSGKTPVNIVAVDEQGKRSDLQFEFELLLQGSRGGSEAPAARRPALPDVNFGNYHALVIGNNKYAHLQDLDSAINDASELARVLRDRYGASVRLLTDANRYEMLSALNDLRAKLTSNDNLLIYYAGHGYLDEVNMRGHWLPTDAEADNTANWISNIAVTDILNVMAAKQVLVIADSCYSGVLTRSVQIRQGTTRTERERLNWLQQMTTKRARVVLSSGGLQPVLDSGGGEHSVFTGALLDVLEENHDILDARTLYSLVAAKVSYAAATVGFAQEPEYAPLRHSGHESGDFFLIPEA